MEVDNQQEKIMKDDREQRAQHAEQRARQLDMIGKKSGAEYYRQLAQEIRAEDPPPGCLPIFIVFFSISSFFIGLTNL